MDMSTNTKSPASTVGEAATIPRGWNRPIKPLALIVVGGAVLLIWLVLMAVSVWYFYEHWEARLTLSQQAVHLRLPEGMVAMAEVGSPLKTRIDMRPVVKIPVKQTMSVQLPDHLQARASIKTTLPVETTVTVEQMVPVSTTLNMQVALRSWLPTMPVSVPVTLQVPLKLTVPVKTEVPVDLDVAISGELPPTLNIPIDTVFAMRPHVKGVVSAHMSSQTAFHLLSPTEPFPLAIERANLSVPFNLTFLKQRAP